MVSRGLGWFVVGRRWQVLLGPAYRVGRAGSKSDEVFFHLSNKDRPCEFCLELQEEVTVVR